MFGTTLATPTRFFHIFSLIPNPAGKGGAFSLRIGEPLQNTFHSDLGIVPVLC